MAEAKIDINLAINRPWMIIMITLETMITCAYSILPFLPNVCSVFFRQNALFTALKYLLINTPLATYFASEIINMHSNVVVYLILMEDICVVASLWSSWSSIATKNTKFINYVCNLLVRMEISKQCYMHMVAEKCFKSAATAAMVPPQITGCVRVSEYSNGYKIIMIYNRCFLLHKETWWLSKLHCNMAT